MMQLQVYGPFAGFYTWLTSRLGVSVVTVPIQASCPMSKAVSRNPSHLSQPLDLLSAAVLRQFALLLLAPVSPSVSIMRSVILFIFSTLSWLVAPRDAGILYEVWHTRAAQAMARVKAEGGLQLTIELVIQSAGQQQSAACLHLCSISAR